MFDGHEVMPETVLKRLDVTIYKNLHFKEHTNMMGSKLNRVIYHINRKKHLLNKQARKLAMDALVMSRIDYCNTVRSRTSKEQKFKINTKMLTLFS